MRRALVEVIGDAASLIAGMKKSSQATLSYEQDLKKLAVTAKKTTATQLEASARRVARVNQEVSAFKHLAAQTKRGSVEQQVALSAVAKKEAELARMMGHTAAAARKQAEATRSGELALGRYARGLVAGSGALSSLGRSLAFASGAYLGAAGLIFGIKAAVTASASFNNTLQKTVGLAGIAQNAIAGFGKRILALAPAVGQTPEKLAGALYFISSSGIKAANAFNVLRVSARAATAGLGDAEVVADALTSAINAYGAANLSAGHAADVLVATVREGKGEAEAFSSTIGNVSAVAAELGVRFNEVGAALAAMTQLGTPAEIASVQLNQVFNALIKQTPQAAKALKAVGLSGAELRQELRDRGLLATLNTMKDAFGGNAVAMKRVFPEIRAFRGVLALVGHHAEQTNEVFGRMTDTTGSLAKAFNAVGTDAAVRFGKARAAIEAMEIMIGSALLPALGSAADAMAKWLGNAKNQEALNDQMKKLVDLAGEVVGAVSKVVDMFGGLNKAIVYLTALWVAWKAQAVGAAVAVMTTNIMAANITASVWKAALISTGWGALAVAAGLAAGYVITHWEQVKGWFRTFWAYLKASGMAAFAAVTEAGKAAAYGLTKLFLDYIETILGVLSHLPMVGEMAARALRSVKGFEAALKPDFNKMGEQWAKGFASVGRTAATAAANAFQKALPPFLRGTLTGPQGKPAKVPLPPGMRGPASADQGTGDTSATTGTADRPSTFNKLIVPYWLRLAQARAETTKTTADDVKVAKQIRDWITRLIKSGKLRGQAILDAYGELQQANSTIWQAQADAAKKASDAEKKHAAEVKRAMERNQREMKKVADALKAQVKKAAANLTSAIKSFRGALESAMDTARGQVGELFAGPVLQPTQDQIKQRLGVHLAGGSVGSLTADLHAQVKAARAFQHDLAVIRKRGGSAQLIAELTQSNDVAQAHTLAGGSAQDFKGFIAQFRAREQLVKQIAIRTPEVKLAAHNVTLAGNRLRVAGGNPNQTIIIEIDGQEIAARVTTRTEKTDRRNTHRRRGRAHPGGR